MPALPPHAAGRARGPDLLPTLVTLDRPDGPIWRYREDHVLSLLTREELATWHAARATAERQGLLMMAHPLHAAVRPQALER